MTKTGNNAIFGLFDPYGRKIAEGSIQRMENEAIRILKCREYASLRISVCIGEANEGQPVLTLRYALGDIRITNALAESKQKKRCSPNEVEDFVNNLLECDCLVDRPDADGSIRCNFGCGLLWENEYEKLQERFDIKCIMAEGDNLAVMIRN